MSIETIHEKAKSYIQELVGLPLCYGIKSPDLDLYDFGFGEYSEKHSQIGQPRKVPTCAIHAVCEFDVICRKEKRIVHYDADICNKRFHAEIHGLIGLKVKRVALNANNILWIDFGEYWIVFQTFQNDEESWRFLYPYSEKPHLVAANSWIDIRQ